MPAHDYRQALKDASIRKEPGPLITISREYGCPGSSLGILLSGALKRKLDLKGGYGDWQVLGKEIIQEAARELKVPAALVERISEHEKPGMFAELLRAISTEYVPEDLLVKRTVADLVRRFGYLGKFILVGRGGAMLNRDLGPRALHIRLYAPLAWRIERIKVMHRADEEQARRLIEIADREREYLREFYAGEKPGPEYFDLSFNCAALRLEEMTAAVLAILTDRRIVE